MAEHEVRSRAVYDHDKEEPRPAGRRRRQVADWGVGEEIFDHMPGRRFERRPHQDIPRGDAEDGRRTIVIETGDEELPSAKPARAVIEDEFATREEALRAREAHDQLWGGDEPFVTDEQPVDDPAPERQVDEWAAGDEPFAEPSAKPVSDEAEFVAASGGQHDTGEFAPVAPWQEEDAPGETDGVVRGGQAGRRTVKIGGRPAEFHGPPARARQRPPRAMHERLGPRPDRVAMWAFALGILLILIAVITGNA
jgi:hypothetical protein